MCGNMRREKSCTKIFLEVLLNEEKNALGNVPFMLSIRWNVFAFKKLLKNEILVSMVIWVYV